MVSISPHLWFDNNASEAVAFYVSVFPDSEILGGLQPTTIDETEGEATGSGSNCSPSTFHDDSMQVIDFRIGDLKLSAFNGGPHHEFNDSISLAVTCTTQTDVDSIWDELTADGGTPLTCGWVRDRFGISWQIIPDGLDRLLGDPDQAKAKRAVGALLGMGKIVLADIEAAMDCV